MAEVVRTEEELKEAIKNKEKQIIIENEGLGKNVIRFKKIKKLSKWTLCTLLAAVGAGSIGIALAPATGGGSAVVGGGLSGILFSITTAGGTTISTAAIIAIGALSILGSAVLYALWKDYNVVIEGEGQPSHGKFRVILDRK